MIFNLVVNSGEKTVSVIENFYCVSYDPMYKVVYYDSTLDEYREIENGGPYYTNVGEIIMVFVTDGGPTEFGLHPSPIYSNNGYETVFQDGYCWIMKIIGQTANFGLLIT